jgi:hypothetical protein
MPSDEGTAARPPARMHWSLTCAGDAGIASDIALAPSAPATWPEGHRYTVLVGWYDAERGPRVSRYDANGAPIPAGCAPVQTFAVSC